MQTTRRLLGVLTIGVLLSASDASAQGLPWQEGPLLAPIGDNLAEIRVPEGFLFLDAEGTQMLMELTENPLTNMEVGTIAAADDSNWFLVFEYEEMGYVSDKESATLDADAILSSIRRGTEAANEERRKRGWGTMSIVGWDEVPHYDSTSNNLTWAIRTNSDGSEGVNKLVKLLGRRGVMTATLVSGPDELMTATKMTDVLLGTFAFRPGNKYSEFVPGSDRVAEIGLTALIAGGAGAALVKSGLLARLWKLVVVAFVGVAAFVKRLFTGSKPAVAGGESSAAG